MSINSLPSGLQEIIQQGFLERTFQDQLRPKLAYRMVADRVDFHDKVGESVTKTRPGLLAPSMAALSPTSPTDMTSGLTFNDFGVEQYVLTVNQYGAGARTNIVTEGVAIQSKFLQDAKGLGFQAGQTVDRLARNALLGTYMGGNTRVRVTLGSNGPTISVDDVRGFSAGQTVLVNGNPYTIAAGGVATDGTNVSTLVINDDTSNFLGGKSGTLTMTSNVSVANGTAGNAVIAITAPLITRPNGRSTTAALQAGDTLACSQIIAAVAALRDNNVPDIDGFYNCYVNATQNAGLQNDPIYQNYAKTNIDYDGFKQGWIVQALGVRFIMTTEAPIQSLNGFAVQRGMIVGKGALVEGVYTNNGYKNQDEIRKLSHVSVVDDIAHIVTGPTDNLQQWVTQAWDYIGGFVAPTDSGTNSLVLPSASNASYKRGVILESL